MIKEVYLINKLLFLFEVLWVTQIHLIIEVLIKWKDFVSYITSIRVSFYVSFY